MKVNIVLTENPDAPVWDPERFTATTDYLNVEASSQDADAAIEEAKGVVLCAMGYLKKVPNKVEFKIDDKRVVINA